MLDIFLKHLVICLELKISQYNMIRELCEHIGGTYHLMTG